MVLELSSSVESEEPVDLCEGVGQAAHAEHHRGAVIAGFDPQHQIAVVEVRVRNEPATRPELRDAVRRLLRTDGLDLYLMRGS